MEISTILIIALPLLLFIFVHRFISHEELPHISFLSYLPGGPMFSLLLNPQDVICLNEHLFSQNGPVFFSRLGFEPTINTSCLRDIVHLLSSSSDFGRPEKITVPLDSIVPRGLSSLGGREHDDLKRLLRSGFNPNMLEGFTEKIHHAVIELLESLRELSGKTVYIEEHVRIAVNRIILNVAFGVNMDFKTRSDIAALIAEVLRELTIDTIAYPIRYWLAIFGCRKRFMLLASKFRAIVLDIVLTRMKKSERSTDSDRRNMLDCILDVSQGDMDLAVSLVIEMILAGSITVLQSCLWMIIAICSNPSVHRKFVIEIDSILGNKDPSAALNVEDLKRLRYVNNVWNETLRRWPAVTAVFRKAMRDVTLKGSGTKLRKGQLVQGFVIPIYKDKNIWEKPSEFIPDRMDSVRNKRYSSAYVPFGAGSYNCLGKFLADFEGPLIVAQIFRKFDIELACDPADIKIKMQFVGSPRLMKGNKEHLVPFRINLRQG